MGILEEFEKIIEEKRSNKDAAFQLWTWLPSYKDAQKHHGDYASEFTPCAHDVMIEACMFIAKGLNVTEQDIKDAGEWFVCSCGQDHGEPNGN